MALEKLHFKASDGTALDVHYMQDKLSYKKMRGIEKEYRNKKDEMGDALLSAALDKEDYEKVENLSMRDFSRFMALWAESEDAPLGESATS